MSQCFIIFFYPIFSESINYRKAKTIISSISISPSLLLVPTGYRYVIWASIIFFIVSPVSSKRIHINFGSRIRFWIRMRGKSRIRIQNSGAFVTQNEGSRGGPWTDALNGGLEAQKIESCMVCRSVFADSYHFNEKDPDPHKN
jgi:hypothetical protein